MFVAHRMETRKEGAVEEALRGSVGPSCPHHGLEQGVPATIFHRAAFKFLGCLRRRRAVNDGTDFGILSRFYKRFILPNNAGKYSQGLLAARPSREKVPQSMRV